ncbi:DUF3696 domain-containing protein [Clostridium estertheticum]|uniref:DUF3696 domain-containing protein n=1 Tax=Clostridium estertheticum TaxID=238834 RepID=UPI001C7CEE52|nr:DUF3696 domain-containing protein [Clostridium estertheticum]MBX4263766.1 DUF3696 domain-containing protein [Clostridium estertheticum]WLC87580.1 DUF3696 domain-containing protein [Clostridium estertheticum]
MINSIKLNNFKCFENLNTPMSNLNLLSGINSMGKSTIIQALLLLRQSFEQNSLQKGIFLRGSYVNIGMGKDLLYNNAHNSDDICISIKDEKENIFKWSFIYNKDSDFLAIDYKKSINIDSPKGYSVLNLFNNKFEYLSAERSAPQNSYEKSYFKVHERNQIGIHGELATYYLSEKWDSIVENKSVIYDKENDTSHQLQFQVEKWLSEISPGLKITVDNYNNNADFVGLRYRIPENRTVNTYSALNVGFGITYVLPVIISLLKANKGDLVIIENPEAHLHPKGQRKMGELIAKAAAGGVQIIIETHSDHVLNGIRLSVKNEVVKGSETKLYFFEKVIDHDGMTKHRELSPEILKDGRLTSWPEGFFDEWDKAIDEMF